MHFHNHAYDTAGIHSGNTCTEEMSIFRDNQLQPRYQDTKMDLNNLGSAAPASNGYVGGEAAGGYGGGNDGGCFNCGEQGQVNLSRTFRFCH